MYDKRNGIDYTTFDTGSEAFTTMYKSTSSCQAASWEVDFPGERDM